ncbi:hypothetical protein [Arenimonas sp.]|uniref:hypothetical protein n=1 Tax=Arenimonas sp. TaxID=1872635 RepID=UPI0025F020F6|nr:hypothetical protein [Arenimonas sp.]
MTISEKNLRAIVDRRLRQSGQRLMRVPEHSPDFPMYGPYMVVDDRKCMVASGYSLSELAEEFGIRQT